ncbi:MAG: hypothetical protein JW878_09350 [Methanomicrobia archaeon]|nr:hypothetical protein [Methanomicrobia archaeon]
MVMVISKRYRGVLIVTLVTLLLSAASVLPVIGSNVIDASISRTDAYELVIDQVLNGSTDGTWAYVSCEPVKAGTVVESWYGSIELPQEEGWFFFIDDHPRANWEHPCRYVFVDLTGNITVYTATTPPTNLGELAILRGPQAKSGREGEVQTKRYPSITQQMAAPDQEASEHLYAVIISGGYDLANNWCRYWNDVAFIYTTLTQIYGYADDHIYVLMADGTDPGDDRRVYEWNSTRGDFEYWIDSSPLDLDGDGDGDVDYATTRANITAVFDALSGTIGAGDSLFVFATDHGSYNTSTQKAVLILWGDYIYDDEFTLELNKISNETEAVMIVMAQCFSGGFIADLLPGSQDRVIATACNETELSWAMLPYYYYDEFSYLWTSAVAWQTPEGVPVNADSNSDGAVSMREAFDYAVALDTANETPQYSESPAGVGSNLTLGSLSNPIFDTGQSEDPYPSIQGIHNGTITPSYNLTVSKLYTYPCAGTGGHAEYVKMWNSTDWNVTATWDGYNGDWHNLSFDEPFTLKANEEYHFTLITGSYPQIIHESSKGVIGGRITCTEFVDVNGKRHEGWIPAIRLE